MMAEKFRVVGMGDLVVDMTVTIEKFPVEPGPHQVVDQIDLQPGGMGNFIIAGSRIGLEMIPLGLIGSDPYGAAMVRAFQAEGINVSRILPVEDSSTRVILVLVEPGGQHTYLAHLGTGFPNQPLHDTWKAAVINADALLVEGYSLNEPYICKAIFEAMELARPGKGLVFFDPGPTVNQITKEILTQTLEYSDVVLLTEEELHMITGSDDDAAARTLLSYGPTWVCVKQGAAGCRVLDQDQTIVCPAFSVEVRDTNGAGDSFSAAFIYGFLSGWPLEKMGAFANAMGAAKVKKLGAGRNVPTREEIDEILRENHFDPDQF